MKAENAPFNLAMSCPLVILINSEWSDGSTPMQWWKHSNAVMVTNDGVEQVQGRMAGVEVERKCWQLFQWVFLKGEERNETVV